MKLAVLLLASMAGLVASEPTPHFTYYETTTKDGSPGIDVHFYAPERGADVYRVYLDFTTEAGREMTISRLVDIKGNRSSVTLISVIFDTGVCRVKAVRVEELTATKTHSRSF